ncbi:helicase-related protein [Thermostichus sp. MS-CIW-37]
MSLPTYIDNQRHKLTNVIQRLIFLEKQTELDIATGFFRIEAWIKLERAFNKLARLRLLIGRDPTIKPAEPHRIDLQDYLRRELQRQLETSTFELEYKQCIDRLIAFLKQDHVDVRLYGAIGERTPFLHAKAYLFPSYSIVGSSNFTVPGLEGNTKLNVLLDNAQAAQEMRNTWFTEFWEHPSVDKDYKSKLIAELDRSKFGSRAYTPHQILMRCLYTLFQPKQDPVVKGQATTLELADFQQEGFERALELLERHGGVIVADAVGLGKTYIGLRLIDHLLAERRKPGYLPRALVISPAQVRNLVWEPKLREFGLVADLLSQEELGRSDFNSRRYSHCDIVLVDESHNFRNNLTARYANLQRLICGGRRNKWVVLLTATPINNTIFDLYHQVLLLTRNDDHYYSSWGIPNLSALFKKLDKGEGQITELLFQTMVRRSRLDVLKRQQAGEKIIIGGQEIRFPRRILKQFTYNFESSFQGLYSRWVAYIENLNLAPYNLENYVRQKNDKLTDRQLRNEVIGSLMKTLYLKRLESSIKAFEVSICWQSDFQGRFLDLLQQGHLLDGSSYRRLMALEAEEQEDSVEQVLVSLPEVNPEDYDLDKLTQAIQADQKTLAQIIQDLTRIQARVQSGEDSDLKLMAFKRMMLSLEQDKVLVFTYFKDTAEYLYQQLLEDKQWLEAMAEKRSRYRNFSSGLRVGLLTGKTPSREREMLVRRFAPRVNRPFSNPSGCGEDYQEVGCSPEEQIDLLICTDVLSEGQNLQEAAVLVNYDLHWNPVRMIQRAGRIDRLGSPFEELTIVNGFPEQGLELLLGLVRKLQQRIALIDQQVGLDASVLGEVISERSLEEIRLLKEAQTPSAQSEILQALEKKVDLVSMDEMRFPLLEFIQQSGLQAVEEIPLGIHSTRYQAPQDGLFLAFQVKDRHFWHFYPRIGGRISVDVNHLQSDWGSIFQLLYCRPEDFPKPDDLPPAPFDGEIFEVLQPAIQNLLNLLNRSQGSSLLQPSLPQWLRRIYLVLTEVEDAIELDAVTEEARQRVLDLVIHTKSIRTYERDCKEFWKNYQKNRDVANLIHSLDELFIDEGLYKGSSSRHRSPTFFTQEDVQLICYQWFRSDPEPPADPYLFRRRRKDPYEALH